jgi:hypothetical protein
MILDELARYIAASSTSFTVGTNLFKSKFPPTAPDTAVVLHEYGGSAPYLTFGSTDAVFEMPAIQIVCRSTSYPTARTRAEEIHVLLVGAGAVTLTSTSTGSTGVSVNYLSITAHHSPFDMGTDDDERNQIGCNYYARKERS